MSLYNRYAKGEATTEQGFKLTAGNVSYYRDLCEKFHQEITKVKSYLDVCEKIKTHKEGDLFPLEYLERRKEKLEKEVPQGYEEYISLVQEKQAIKVEISRVLPLAMDKEKGKDPEIHENLSLLFEKDKKIDERICDSWKKDYGEIHDRLPKIYFMILEGTDIEIVMRCFSHMEKVLRGTMTQEDAMMNLMDQSEKKFNLPPEVFKDMRSKVARSKRKNHKK